MVKDEERPYGYIYKATNNVNGKIYIGQTTSGRWKDHQTPIKERWKEEVGEALRKERRGEELRYIERAICKYGAENFSVVEQDTAQNQVELDEKETLHIINFDTMNQEKGYNLKEGGLGGRLSEQAKENVSIKISNKYQNDPEYYDKQLMERRERANDPEWLQKMTGINQERAKDNDWINKMAEVNQEIARNPVTREIMSDSMSDKWQDIEYQKSVSNGVSKKWQDADSREKYFKSKTDGKREIPDKKQFLKDIQEMMKKDINTKYEMDGKCINKRIEEMLGHRDIKTYSEAKKFLEEKNIEKIACEINEKLRNQPEKSTVKKAIPEKEEFLKDIQNLKLKEMAEKYSLSNGTINSKIQEMLGDHNIHNYTEARAYLEEKDIKKVLEEINDRLSNIAEKYQGTTEITNKKEFLEDIQNLRKKEIDYKYNMDGKTINRRIEDMLGDEGVKNYTEAREYLKDKDIDEVIKNIDKEEGEKEIEDEKKEKESEESSQPEKETKKNQDKEEGKENKENPEDRKDEKLDDSESQDKEPLDGDNQEEIPEDIRKLSEFQQEDNVKEGVDTGIQDDHPDFKCFSIEPSPKRVPEPTGFIDDQFMDPISRIKNKLVKEMSSDGGDSEVREIFTTSSLDDFKGVFDDRKTEDDLEKEQDEKEKETSSEYNEGNW